VDREALVSIRIREPERVVDVLGEISEDESLTDEALSASIKTKTREKWDWLLTEQLLCADYAASSLDVGAARAACRALVE
jgi:hypothetical protein